MTKSKELSGIQKIESNELFLESDKGKTENYYNEGKIVIQIGKYS